MLSGGLRYASTTGYYLPAFQAETIRHRVVVLSSSAPSYATGFIALTSARRTIV